MPFNRYLNRVQSLLHLTPFHNIFWQGDKGSLINIQYGKE